MVYVCSRHPCPSSFSVGSHLSSDDRQEATVTRGCWLWCWRGVMVECVLASNRITVHTLTHTHTLLMVTFYIRFYVYLSQAQVRPPQNFSTHTASGWVPLNSNDNSEILGGSLYIFRAQRYLRLLSLYSRNLWGHFFCPQHERLQTTKSCWY